MVHYFQAAISDIAHALESEQFHSFSLINHVSFHDQQKVSDTAVFLCQVVSLINHVSSHGQQHVSDATVYLCQWVVSSTMFHQ